MLSTLFLCINIYLNIAWTALVVRRLHDVGRSGWWYYIPLILLAILYIIIYFSSDAYYAYAFDFNDIKKLGNFAFFIFIIAALGFLLCFIFMFFKSELKPNKWGDSPSTFYEFIPASKKYFIKCIDFKGRSRRSEYWWIYITILLITIIETIIFLLIK